MNMLTRILDIPLAFFTLILPTQGCFIAAIKKRSNGFMPSRFASTHDELWLIIEEADQDGYATYHACASFLEARSDPTGTPAEQKRLGRTKHNVLGAKAFWLDIDVGRGKGYSDQDAAIKALRIFCATLKLPTPIIVSSGWGLHVYWPLQQMLDRAAWERYAQGLKNLCHQHDLRVDHSRTADISSVLRTPGTHNRKHGTVRKVEVDPEFLDIQPYDIEQFKVLADHADAPIPRREDAERSKFDPHGIFKLDKLKDLSYLAAPNRKRIGLACLAGLEDDYPPSSGELIAEQCEQMRTLRDRRGVLEEPLWYAALEVLAFAEDGDRLAHEWSSGDTDRYTPRKTQERLDRARQFGPTTCAKFHELNPTVCERCSWSGKIKSPIVLGRQHATSQGEQHSPPTTRAAQVLPQWEHTQGGALKPKSYINARLALQELGLRFRHDIFHDKKIVEGGGESIEKLGPQLSDAIVRALREAIIKRFGFDPGSEATREAAERACEENRFDPVLDYLDLRWDGQPRLDRWMITYLGAEDTELNRAVSRLSLIAAVRRARYPGTKFDQIIVLEGVEGTNKSSAIEVMAGSENFSDQTIIGLSDERQQERLKGKWLYEIADLTGMKKAEVDAVKAFASRIYDRARGAYERFVTEPGRRCIFFATTNEPTYLKSQTGNRRFWPVKTGHIDLDALRRDRDQLWAEAAQAEASGASIVLPEHLWGAARVEQEKRREHDPWDDMLADVKGEICRATNTPTGEEVRVSSIHLLTNVLGLDASKMGDREAKRLGYCMRRLEWNGPKVMRMGGKPQKGYWRPVTRPKEA
jgi:hypothetical protein